MFAAQDFSTLCHQSRMENSGWAIGGQQIAGTQEGLFRVVYRFENEQLLEVINRTAHAAALSALVEMAKYVPILFRCLRLQC
jgi:hypothetical protein